MNRLFQQNGVTAHTARATMEIVKEEFQGTQSILIFWFQPYYARANFMGPLDLER